MKDISLNFGAVRDSVSRLSSQELLKENKSDTLKNFTKKVRTSPTLLKQHLVFKNFEDCKPFEKDRLAERFINQNLSLLQGINWQDVIKENREVRITLLEDSHVESRGGNKNELFNHIHTLMESKTKPGYSNFEKEQTAYEFLLEHLTRKEEKNNLSEEKNDSPDIANWEFITKLAVNNFNKRYSHLNEEEQHTLSMLLSDTDKKKNYIQDLKNENLAAINRLLKECDVCKAEVLNGFKEKLERIQEVDYFSMDNIIIELSDLKDTLSE